MPNRVLPVLILCLGVVHFTRVASYSQIALSGSGQGGDGPKIFKAMNVDLIFPQYFNASERPPSSIPPPTAPLSTPSATPPSSLPSNRGPAIFVTPASDDVDAAATPPAPIPATEESAAGLARIVAETFAMPANEQHQHLEQQPQQLEMPQPVGQQQQEQQPHASTGRAVDYRPTYPFGQLITPLINNARPRPKPSAVSAPGPVVYGGRRRPQPQSGVGKLVYPSGYQAQRGPPNRAEPNRSSAKAQIADRFSPSEAVVSHQYKNNNNKQHQHHHDPKVPASSNQVSSYVPPKDLYSFPPNLNAKYPSPSEDPKAGVPTSSVTSYLPPPSGPLTNAGDYPLVSNSDGYVYSAPASPDLMPSIGDDGDSKMPGEDTTTGADGADTDPDDGDDSIGVLPASAMDGADGGGDGGMPSMAMVSDDHHDHPLTGYDTDKEYPTPPPGWLEEHPETAHDHPHHDHDHGHGNDHVVYDDHHDHFPSFPIFRHPHPEIIYTDHYHHHPHQEPPAMPETTVAPPPEPRVKKYSYFYIGRKLWYIPLYFTVWFSFYVLWLIVKSIARHKVNLPNHYVSRRSVPEYSTQKRNDHIDQLTDSVLNQIETFRKKHRQ